MRRGSGAAACETSFFIHKKGAKLGDMPIARNLSAFYYLSMQEKARSIFNQILPILASAGAAAAFAFAQSIAAHAGFCPAPVVSIEATGALGGTIKAAHQLVRAFFVG